MADLLSTTVNGKIIVTDTAKIGQATFTASSDSRLNITGVNDLQLDSTSLLRPQGLYYGDQKIAKTNIASKGNTSNYYTYLSPVTATGARLGEIDQRWDVVYANTGNFSESVIAQRFIMDNATSLSAYEKDSTTNRRTLIYLAPNNNINIGSEAGEYMNKNHIYLNAKAGYIGFQTKLGAGTGLVLLGGDYSSLRPGDSTEISLGLSSNRWNNLWLTGTVNSSSDAREKNSIVAIKDYSKNSENGNQPLLEKFFKELKPVTYYFNNENDSQLHIGFIAQDLAESVEKLGVDENDFAFLTHDFWTDEEGKEKDRYSVAYSEFIALNTYMIQKQQKIIENLEQKIEKLEKQLSEVK